MRSPRWAILGFLVVAVLAAVGAGLQARHVIAKKPLEERLQESGQVVAATVLEVTNSAQYGAILEVRVRLPDGRVADVDVRGRASNGGLREGAPLRVLVDPQDPTVIRPVDGAPLGDRWLPPTVPYLAISAGALLIGCIGIGRASSRRPH
jgi:hypothetical protein